MTPEEHGKRFWTWYRQGHVPPHHTAVVLCKQWRDRARFLENDDVLFVEVFRLAAEGDELSIKIRNLLLKHRLTCGE